MIGFMGSTIQKPGKVWSNGWTDWESILHIQVYNADESGNGQMLNKLAP